MFISLCYSDTVDLISYVNKNVYKSVKNKKNRVDIMYRMCSFYMEYKYRRVDNQFMFAFGNVYVSLLQVKASLYCFIKWFPLSMIS